MKISHIKQRLMAKAAMMGVPLSGGFELTPRCNFSCKMCYVHMTPEEMKPLGRERSAEEWIDLARQAHGSGMTFLLLTGGEPFLRPDFPQIYQGMAKLGLSISINTNASLLNDSLKALFIAFPPASVNVTLYGTTPESYGTLCGVPDGFERTIQALDWFQSHHILVNLNATITPYNMGQIRQIEDFALSRSLNLRLTTYNFPPVRRNGAPTSMRLDGETAGRLRAENYLRQNGIEALNKLVQELDASPEAVSGCLPECGDPMHCYAGRGQFWVAWNGRMTPCGMFNSPSVDPFADGFASAWQALMGQSAQIRLCPDCVTCPEKSTCVSCAAVTSAETGRFDGKPEYVCRLNHSYREALKALAAKGKDVP